MYSIDSNLDSEELIKIVENMKQDVTFSGYCRMYYTAGKIKRTERTKMKKTVIIVLLLSIIALSGCTTDEKNTSAETEISTETESNDEKTEEEELE